jgi:tRNA A-37 threonylcarbamoyl transferase component Bud32
LHEYKKPVLLVAAESIAMVSGMGESVADVLRARALRHYSEGLRQYLAIRLRSMPAAERALAGVEARAEELSAAALTMPPGPRAHLYRMARQLVAEHRLRASATESPELLWLAPAEQAPHSYIAALARVRRELLPEHAELLELRYARELSPEEVAFVVDGSPEDVMTRLDEAAQKALSILGDAPPSRLGGLRGALQEAFALAPSDGGQKARGRTALPKGTVIGERYAVGERVGEGSFGDVYRALDTDVPGHVVALKLLHKAATSEEARKAALRELRLIASVFHPSVVDFKDHGWYQDRLWFVMPWYEGETLEERIQREPLTRAEAQEIFLPLAQALATMHAAGIRHQDIKPDNIFLARLGDAESGHERVLPVLIDLGVAAKEAEMIVAGTPLYFAPEIAAQYAGKDERPKVTHKADVFSLVLSLRNALEPSTQEQVPGTAVEAFIGHRADHPPGPPEAKELRFLAPFFARCLAKHADERPSAQELIDLLTVLTRPEERRQRRRAVMRWAMPIALGSLLGLSSVTYGYIVKRAEAMQAVLRAEVTENKLDRESERRMQLEESFQNSELTRQELADKLVERGGEIQRLGAQLGKVRRSNNEFAERMRALSAELDATHRSEQVAQRKLEQQAARVATLEGNLFSSEQRRAFLESELRETRSRMNAAESELNDVRERARTLLAELDRMRDEVESHVSRASILEQSLAKARAERQEAEDDLAEARAQANELERKLRASNASANAALEPSP